MTKVQDEGMHILYKNLGETPWGCMERFRSEKGELTGVSMTYAGRLDPMAEGLLIVLSGESVHEKEKYMGLPKTYEMEILWGMETDTADVLGIVSENSYEPVSFQSNLKNPSGFLRPVLDLKLSREGALTTPASGLRGLRKDTGSTRFSPSPEHILKILNEMIGKFEQKYPAYSSKPVSGKPLFQWAREGRLSEIEIPSHEVEIQSVQFISRRFVTGRGLLAEIIRRILLVQGDFRQEETIAKWQEILATHLDLSFAIDKIALSVSSGFYVRQFVKDLAGEFGTSATTFHIKRTKVGSFTL